MPKTSAPSPLAAIPMFAGLSPDRLEQVREGMHERSVSAGADIITQGEPGDAVFVILEGAVKVYRRTAAGAEVILSVLGPGEVVGEMSAADSQDRWASVAALGDARVLWLDGEAFRRLVEEEPSVRSALIELLSRRVRSTDARVEALATLDVEGRVAWMLLNLAKGHGEPKAGGGTRISIPLTQGDVAAMTGASRVRVNQVLSKFRRHGWVTLDGRRRISVRDESALGSRSV
jgi:CRP/FNR family transcriptional regulator, cyclic AMP receptor protein